MSKRKNVFIDGPITPEFISDSIAKHQTKTSIGAHNIFLGQVRDDKIEDKSVQAIEYSLSGGFLDRYFGGGECGTREIEGANRHAQWLG